MPRLAANLTLLFTERPFLERFGAAAEAGFKAVEFLFPYDHEAAEIRNELVHFGLELALFNLPPGNWQAGDRGLAALPERRDEFRRSLDIAFTYAEALECRRLHVMAGVLDARHGPAICRETLLDNLALAADRAAAAGFQLLLEPLNSRDVPGYFYSHTRQAVDVITALGRDNVKLQLDLYHRQVMEGNLIAALHEHSSLIGHVQIAGVPGRHEPGCGEINYPAIFRALDEIGYGGFVGCEYHPENGTETGLGWASAYLSG